MRYFHTLPQEIQDKAWSDLGADLVQQWIDRWIDEEGEYLDSHIEEHLLEILSSNSSLLNSAIAYYQQSVENEVKS